jgi:hypothetical protein
MEKVWELSVTMAANIAKMVDLKSIIPKIISEFQTIDTYHTAAVESYEEKSMK